MTCEVAKVDARAEMWQRVKRRRSKSCMRCSLNDEEDTLAVTPNAMRGSRTATCTFFLIRMPFIFFLSFVFAGLAASFRATAFTFFSDFDLASASLAKSKLCCLRRVPWLFFLDIYSRNSERTFCKSLCLSQNVALLRQLHVMMLRPLYHQVNRVTCVEDESRSMELSTDYSKLEQQACLCEQIVAHC